MKSSSVLWLAIFSTAATAAPLTTPQPDVDDANTGWVIVDPCNNGWVVNRAVGGTDSVERRGAAVDLCNNGWSQGSFVRRATQIARAPVSLPTVTDVP